MNQFFDGAVSPKVVVQVVTGIVVAAIVAGLNGITPEMLEWAGDFAPAVTAAIVALVAGLAGYAKGDPLRVTEGLSDVPFAPADDHEDFDGVDESDDAFDYDEIPEADE